MFYTHRSLLLSTMVREASPCSGRWLMQRLITGRVLRINDCECSRDLYKAPKSPGSISEGAERMEEPEVGRCCEVSFELDMDMELMNSLHLRLSARDQDHRHSSTEGEGLDSHPPTPHPSHPCSRSCWRREVIFLWMHGHW